MNEVKTPWPAESKNFKFTDEYLLDEVLKLKERVKELEQQLSTEVESDVNE